jgi:hypothetical protein
VGEGPKTKRLARLARRPLVLPLHRLPPRIPLSLSPLLPLSLLLPLLTLPPALTAATLLTLQVGWLALTLPAQHLVASTVPAAGGVADTRAVACEATAGVFAGAVDLIAVAPGRLRLGGVRLGLGELRFGALSPGAVVAGVRHCGGDVRAKCVECVWVWV